MTDLKRHRVSPSPRSTLRLYAVLIGMALPFVALALLYGFVFLVAMLGR